MSDDQTFRIILIVGVAAIVPIGIYHRIKSQASGERLDRREEGLFFLATLRPVAAARMAGLLGYMINPTSMTWSSLTLPHWLRWAGVVLGITAGILLIVTFRALGPNLTDTVVTRREHSLVTSGPYQWVRHPFYVAFAGAVAADSLVTANWFLAITGGTCILLLVFRTRIEEEKLIERFGADYKVYMECTGRFFPRLSPTRNRVK